MLSKPSKRRGAQSRRGLSLLSEEFGRTGGTRIVRKSYDLYPCVSFVPTECYSAISIACR